MALAELLAFPQDRIFRRHGHGLGEVAVTYMGETVIFPAYEDLQERVLRDCEPAIEARIRREIDGAVRQERAVTAARAAEARDRRRLLAWALVALLIVAVLL